MRRSILVVCAVCASLMAALVATPAECRQPFAEETGWAQPQQRVSEGRIGPRALLDECKEAADKVQRAVGCYFRTISTVASAILETVRTVAVAFVKLLLRLVVTIASAIVGLVFGALFG